MKPNPYCCRFLVFCLLLLFQQNFAFPQSVALQSPLYQSQTAALQTRSLKIVLRELENRFNVYFNFDEVDVGQQTVNAPPKTSVNLDEALRSVLDPLQLKYEKVGDKYYTIYPQRSRKPDSEVQKQAAQESTSGLKEIVFPAGSENQTADAAKAALQISGKVTDDKGAALPGVTVLLKGTVTGTATNAEGTYSLTVPDGNGTLIFSYIGFITEEVAINNRSTIDVSMVTDIKALGEVVVVGYGTQKKSDVTGSLSSISSKDFQEQPVTRADQILQGRAAGVQVTNAAGAPGGDVRIRIRGANSINGDNNPLYVVDGFVGADFNTINPEDIASIQVLKDASATAIYGSRGANGVIIITTKSGSKGGMQVNFGTRFSTSEVIKTIETLNAAEFAETVNARALATGTNPKFTADQIDAYRLNGGTDWQDEIFRKAGGMEYLMGVSGGKEKTTYLISGNYLNQNGVIKNSDFKRYAIRSNIASQLSDRFSVRFNFTGNRRENHNTIGTQGKISPLTQALSWAPTTPVRNANGGYVFRDPVGSIFDNPVALATDRDLRSERTNANLVGGARYEFFDGLSLDVQYGINYLNQQDKGYFGPVITSNVPLAARTSIEQVTLQNINTLNYRRIFGSIHSLDVTGVFETQKFVQNFFYAQANNLTFPDLSYNNLALAASGSINSGFSKWTLLSYLGRVNYSLKDRYLLSATIRRDGSSKFQGKNKFSVFPSVALGWRLSEESFLKDLTVFSNLKLRGSWGLTGSQAINPYGTLSSYFTDAENAALVFNPAGGLTSGIILGNPGNANLKWETTEQVNAGLDADLLEGKVTFSADYFVKNTRDLLVDQPLPLYIGGNKIAQNVGEVQNRGWELSLGVTPVSTPAFSWTSSLNLSLVKNKVVSLGLSDTIFTGSNVGSGMSSQSEFVLIPGQSLGSHWGLKYLGTWKPSEADQAALFNEKPGDSRYEDVDGDNAITARDFQVIGSGIPKTSLGWNNTFAYKGLSLNVFFQGIFGFDKLNYTYAAAISGSADARQPTLADIKDRYIPGVNETSDIPAFSTTNKTYLQSTRFLEKGDFVRLKNVSLAYSLPKPLVRNIAEVRVFVSATNLFTLTKYKGFDPESSSVGSGTDVNQSIDYGSYPNSKMYTAGINLTF
jgi:TonB-linked SusC/RagA family outer membrane protein